MPKYKIDLVQVRKMTVYCSAEDEEGAEKWFEENRERLFNHLDITGDDGFYYDDVYCYTTYSFTEDNSSEILFDLLHGEDCEDEKQMDAVYKVLKEDNKQNPEQDSE